LFPSPLVLVLALGAFIAANPSALVQGRLRCVGSETMAPLLARWAEAFARRQPAAVLQIEGRGSESAVRALLSGTTDIAALSRPLEESEAKALRARFGDFLSLAVGGDTLRLMARVGSSAIRDPSRAALAFRQNLSELRSVGRLPGSGTRREAMQMLGLKEPAEGSLDLYSPMAVQLALRADPRLVGYGSVSRMLSDVRPVAGPILGRTLFLVVPRRNLSNPIVATFVEFIRSEEGRQIVLASGFSPLDAAQ